VAGSTWYATGANYDADTQATSTSATGVSNDTGSFSYDPAGNPTTLSPTSGASVTQTFNSAQQLTSATAGSTSIAYGYDSTGDRTSMSVSGGASNAYTFNQINQLTSETPGGGAAIDTRITATVCGRARRHLRSSRTTPTTLWARCPSCSKTAQHRTSTARRAVWSSKRYASMADGLFAYAPCPLSLSSTCHALYMKSS
jgi:YD repeat-containing protein